MTIFKFSVLYDASTEMTLISHHPSLSLVYLDRIHLVDSRPEVSRVAPEGDLQGMEKLVHTGKKCLRTGKRIYRNINWCRKFS